MSPEIQLKYFVGPQSWAFFDRLGKSTDWLLEPPSTWELDPSFLEIKEIALALHGVNDATEIGCRIAEDWKVT